MGLGLLFPGQGAQQVGMLADLAAASARARDVLAAADAQLGIPLTQYCFEGPADRLNATDVVQPAMFACSAAALAAMDEALGEAVPSVAMTAGLSLGEYTALYAADAMDFQTCLDLVAKRGRFMQAAADAHPGGMVSIIGLSELKVGELCAAAAAGEVLVPTNFNCPGQIVISGDVAACDRAEGLAERFGAAGAVRLKVTGAFHSPLMQPAADRLAEAMEAVDIREPRCPVVSNVDARPHGAAETIKPKLVAQVTSAVRWEESIRYMLDNGVGEFYEVGPGRVLAGLMRRISRPTPVRSIESANALARLAGELAR